VVAVPEGIDMDLTEPMHEWRSDPLRLRFEGAGPTPLRGEDVRGPRTSFFVGNDPEQWCTGARSFASVRYENLYPGVDLRLRTTDGWPGGT
jgi:hypothetical protein